MLFLPEIEKEREYRFMLADETQYYAECVLDARVECERRLIDARYNYDEHIFMLRNEYYGD